MLAGPTSSPSILEKRYQMCLAVGSKGYFSLGLSTVVLTVGTNSTEQPLQDRVLQENAAFFFGFEASPDGCKGCNFSVLTGVTAGNPPVLMELVSPFPKALVSHPNALCQHITPAIDETFEMSPQNT